MNGSAWSCRPCVAGSKARRSRRGGRGGPGPDTAAPRRSAAKWTVQKQKTQHHLKQCLDFTEIQSGWRYTVLKGRDRHGVQGNSGSGLNIQEVKEQRPFTYTHHMSCPFLCRQMDARRHNRYLIPANSVCLTVLMDHMNNKFVQHFAFSQTHVQRRCC